ncbi:MAG: hypothetical protein EXR28_03675 [Betaproteobacteria bacterium]|nr:hypothetical protein [Betaproteobacteria bacterium]
MPSNTTAPLDKHTAIRMAERMLVMRRFEEKTLDLFQRKLIPGMYHLYIGQEAGGSAILDALVGEDTLLTNHRRQGRVRTRGRRLVPRRKRPGFLRTAKRALAGQQHGVGTDAHRTPGLAHGLGRNSTARRACRLGERS